MSLGSESKSESGKSLDVSESIADIGDPDVNESDEGFSRKQEKLTFDLQSECAKNLDKLVLHIEDKVKN